MCFYSLLPKHSRAKNGKHSMKTKKKPSLELKLIYGCGLQITKRQLRYVDECIGRILRQLGVQHCVVVDLNGIPVRSTMPDDLTIQHVGLFGQLIDKARSIISMVDPTDEITFLRVRSRKHEVFVTPDGQLIFLVIQIPIGAMELAVE